MGSVSIQGQLIFLSLILTSMLVSVILFLSLTRSCFTVIAEVFVRVNISYSSVRRLSYAINFRATRAVSHTLVYGVWFSYATKFRTFSQKYEKYEIKSRTKISAITLSPFYFKWIYILIIETFLQPFNQTADVLWFSLLVPFFPSRPLSQHH